MQTNPFSDIHPSDWSFLDELTSRQPCPNCKKSRKYFCYTCCVALPSVKDKIPFVKLPVKVDIIKHPSEIDGKSTSIHAAILAPDDVTIHTYPHIPTYEDEKVVLVFPCKEAITLEDFLTQRSNIDQETNQPNISSSCKEEESAQRETLDSKSKSLSLPADSKDGKESNCPNVKGTQVSDNTCEIKTEYRQCSVTENEQSLKRIHSNSKEQGSLIEDEKRPQRLKRAKLHIPFERVIFIDSTWNQTSNIVSDERLKDFQRVELLSRDTKFWRKQQGIPTTYLSTIEAIFYFMRDLHITFIDKDYTNDYDDLLLLFCFMYNKIVKTK